jgi:hypothetical protein
MTFLKKHTHFNFVRGFHSAAPFAFEYESLFTNEYFLQRRRFYIDVCVLLYFRSTNFLV